MTPVLDKAPVRHPVRSPALFRHLLAAEWIKLWSLRSTYWVLGVGALTVIGINVNSAASNADRLAHQAQRPPEPAGIPHRPEFLFDPLHTAFVDPAWQLFMIIAATVGAIALFGEYSSGLIRTTFAAVPDRRAVVAAKVTVVSAVMLALGTLVSGNSFGVTQMLLREHGGLSLGDPGALRAVAASALAAPLCALVGMSVAAAVRHAAGSIVAVIALLLLVPALFQGERYRWVKEIGNAMPLSAWERLVTNPERAHDLGKYPLTVTEAWIVYGAWATAAAAIAVLVVRRRDV
ncbi:ABC transporter permease [Streptomyces lunaelactis]|uniref:ABC transporter permease n=2 Tax=Streptomyces lunaelactis TaxID=1535768 RepID=UPI001584D4FA|nr:ABC transporter permease [Streptomyces lunaelactis]NUK05374.1 ABC transporter permease [Streptomyces lunaelactis]NUK06558.1 ABC transporter permease [Streptomyces lunaelactis]NUK16712.1 ABC transporter permease [Streptomyces lunaelactis]NUK36809.1 ABC transporter permease [Streptomyces lunaelactis]NUK54168.1 ABC transporter permease [Streptomyces lunaelactis]